MAAELTTLCYIERDDAYLMLHRVKKERDVNKDKWIGIGGHFESGESPEECLLREAYEETGLTLLQWQFRGIVTFCFREEDGGVCTEEPGRMPPDGMPQSGMQQDGMPSAGMQPGGMPSAGMQPMGMPPICEYMHLYTATAYEGRLSECDEGELVWVPGRDIGKLNLWEGDRIFFELLRKRADFFSLKLSYTGDRLTAAALDGKPMELLDIRDAQGAPTGQTRERGLVHRMGTWHATAHVWIYRKREGGGWDVLLQKRSGGKELFPGRLDISSAGHLPAGSGYMESALRELEEELGLTARREDLVPAGFVKVEVSRTFGGEAYQDREISAVYLYERDVAPEELSLQESEVEAVQWMSYADCLARVEAGDEAFCINPEEFRMLGERFGLKKAAV